ncbi:MAG TPA: aspartyl/asparaginyl beta-hydroxylase domain-containing protein [Caulobacteraceae bacterium]
MTDPTQKLVSPARTHRFADRLRLPIATDVGRLRTDLDRVQDQAWVAHFVPQNYAGDWSVLPLRGPIGETHPVRMIAPLPGAAGYADGPLMARTPYIRALLGEFRCPLQCVRLMRLTAGSQIKTHSDYDLAFEDGHVRLHIPIVTNPGVEFRVNGTVAPMDAGEVWYVRLADPHSVDNRGDTDRIHLVIDAEANDWLDALFERAAAGG